MESFVEVKLSSKGKYSWTIKVDFSGKDLLSRPVDTSAETVRAVELIDGALKATFPNNASKQSATTTFKGFDEED